MKNHYTINEKIRITLIYDSIFLTVFRFALINALLIWTFYQLAGGAFPKISLFFLSITLISHIFIKYELERVLPSTTISENSTDILNSFTKEALMAVLFKKDTKATFDFLFKLTQTKFFLQKAAIDKKDIKILSIAQPELFIKALEIARKINGKYVTSTDLLSAYLLLTENETKLLFANKLKEEDILNINHWARIIHEEEVFKEAKARFVGIGFAETLVWGWTPETKNYTKDLTFSNVKRKAFIEGRETEYQTLLEAMQKDQNNNVLLVGDIGSGKSNLVDNFIYDSYEANLSKKLNHRRFLELTIGPFVAGAANREELETRLQAIIEEVKHSGNVVLYIPEFQNLMGSSSFGIDLSGAILPYLKDGKMPIIATMTDSEYKRFFENNALREVFEVIKLEEPSPQVALKMLFQKTEEIEEQAKAFLSYKAIIAGVKYADKYDVNSSLPGTAVELLSEAANSVYLDKRKIKIVLEEDVLEKVQQKSHIPVGSPKADEKMLLLNLESEMHKFVIGQDEAVRSIAEAMRRIRAGIVRDKPISFLFLGPTGVGKTETAKTLARIYFGGVAHIVRVDMSEYGNPDALERMLQSDSGSFLDQVATHPFSLVLLDEFEKANEKILNLFLQVFDDGRMTDNNGKTISFSNTIIIATSNAGSEFIRESLVNNTDLSSRTLLDYLQKNAIFAPELLNRFDDIVVFKPLNSTEISQIAKLLLSDLTSKMSAQDIVLNFDPQAIERIAQGGFSEEFGARPLARYIQDKVEDVIARKLLSGETARGDKILVSIDPNSNLTISKAS